MIIGCSVSYGSSQTGLLSQVCHLSFNQRSLPAVVKIDGKLKPIEQWQEYIKALKTLGDVWVQWPKQNNDFISANAWLVAFQNSVEPDWSVADVMRWLCPLDFGQAAFLTETWSDPTYRAPGFADQHFSHGWACAFKGAGHDRLVSRRWLDWGPWKLYRDEPNDLSFVLFHDLAADAATALEQAKPGHRRMGISEEGGYLQSLLFLKYPPQGLYIPESQILEVVVHGRAVSQWEMLDACKARHHQVLGPDKPLRNVAFVFMEESAARAHLHELWLRGLECWAIIAGEKVRLDEHYEPGPAPKPEWVRRLDG